MSEQVRVLHVLGGTHLGGAESRVMDMYRGMDREHVQFDFCVHTKDEGYFDKEIEQLGGKIYKIPRFKIYNWRAYKKAWDAFFAEHHEFAAVHGHMTSTASIYLPIAKKHGIPMTIAHARSAGVDHSLKGIATKIIRKPLRNRADYCFACSKIAGEAVFGKKAVKDGKVFIIPNAIATGQFVYSEEVRERMRRKLGFDHKLVIGHAGRFHYAKNHTFLLDVFAEIAKEREDAVLLLVGDGDLRPQIEQKIKELGLVEKVFLVGRKSNMGEYCQAMDVMVFPSHFEGLPGTILETQVAGLPSLISDTITPEVRITDLVVEKSLQDPAKDWAEKAIEMSNWKRVSRLQEIQKAGYDVDLQVKKMETFYTTGRLSAIYE